MRGQMHCNVLKTIYDVNRKTTNQNFRRIRLDVIAKKYKMMSVGNSKSIHKGETSAVVEWNMK